MPSRCPSLVAVRRMVLLALLAVAALEASPAAAQGGRVVVQPFSGPRAAGLRKLLVQNLQQNGVQLVPYDQMRRKAQALGFGRRLNAEQYARVARALRVTAFIDGRVKRRRRRWGLAVRVRGGADGRPVGAKRWGGRTLGSLRAVRSSGYSRLKGLLGSAQSKVAKARRRWQQQQQQEEEQAEREQQRRRQQRLQRRRRQQQRRQQQRRQSEQAEEAADEADSEDEEPGLDEDVDEDVDETPEWELDEDDEDVDLDDDDDLLFDDEDAEEEGDDWFKRYPAASVSLLGGFQTRSLSTTVNINPDARPSGAPQPPGGTETREYTSTGHMELGFQAEFYPGALADDQPVPWFGAVMHFRHSMLLSTVGTPCRSEARCPEGDVQSVDVGTSQREFFLGGRGRYHVWFGERALRLGTEFGYGRFVFNLSPGDLQKLTRDEIVPPFHYSYLQVGLRVGADIIPVYWRMGLQLGYRVGLSPGQQARNIWGTGTARLQGWQVGLESRFDLPFIRQGAFAALQVQHFGFQTEFSGRTACAENAECSATDLWEQWPGDGAEDGIPNPVSDRYWRFGVRLGYDFR